MATSTSQERVDAEVEAYLADLPDEHRDALESIRAAVRAVVPEAREVLSYGVPTFRTRVGIVGYGAFADHCSLFVLSPAVIAAMAHQLDGYATSKGTIRFPADAPLPAELVGAIVRARLAENDARREH